MTSNYILSHRLLKFAVFNQTDIFLSYYFGGQDEMKRMLQKLWDMALRESDHSEATEKDKFPSFQFQLSGLYDDVNINNQEFGINSVIETPVKVLVIYIRSTDTADRGDCKYLAIAINENQKSILGYFTYEYGTSNDADGKRIFGHYICEWEQSDHHNYDFDSLPSDNEQLIYFSSVLREKIKQRLKVKS